jgi:hypothetical protein
MVYNASSLIFNRNTLSIYPKDDPTGYHDLGIQPGSTSAPGVSLGSIHNCKNTQARTPDYCAIPRWYGEVLCRWNSDISETAILYAIMAWLDVEEDIKTRRFENYHIQAVDEPQPMKVPKYRDRIRKVKASFNQGLEVVSFAHAHMPDDLWREMVSMLGEEADQGIWIQMYACLSETKFRILREIFAGSKR